MIDCKSVANLELEKKILQRLLRKRWESISNVRTSSAFLEIVHECKISR
jgi:hypothetical protein